MVKFKHCGPHSTKCDAMEFKVVRPETGHGGNAVLQLSLIAPSAIPTFSVAVLASVQKALTVFI